MKLFRKRQRVDDFQYIRKFSAVSIKNVCIDLGLENSYANIMAGRANKRKIAMVRREIERRLKEINKWS